MTQIESKPDVVGGRTIRPSVGAMAGVAAGPGERVDLQAEFHWGIDSGIVCVQPARTRYGKRSNSGGMSASRIEPSPRGGSAPRTMAAGRRR